MAAHKAVSAIHTFSSKSERKAFVRHVEKRLNITTHNDWYNVSWANIVKLGGGELNRTCEGRFQTLLEEIFPNVKWNKWRFDAVPLDFWETRDNKRAFMNHVAQELEFCTMDRFYGSSATQIGKFGGKPLLRQYRNYLYTCLRDIFQHYNWLPWRFIHFNVPKSYWLNPENVLNCFIEVERQLDITELEDWYNYSINEIMALGCIGLTNTFGASLYLMLQHMYPEYTWKAWEFRQVPRGFWNETKHHRQFLNFAAEYLDVKHLDDWYDVTVSDMRRAGGCIVGAANRKLPHILQTLYPDYPWKMSRFRFKNHDTPRNHWRNTENVKAFLESIADSLGVKSPADWYRVSHSNLKSHGGTGLLPYWPQILHKVYPLHVWKDAEFSTRDRRTTQGILASTMRRVFPDIDVIEEYYVGLRGEADKAVTLDVFVPDFNIALEYMGEQHYIEFVGAYGHVHLQEARDAEKVHKCKEIGVSLVPIPFWWNTEDADSLIATILYFRPDLDIKKPDVEPLVSMPEAAKKEIFGMLAIKKLMTANTFASFENSLHT